MINLGFTLSGEEFGPRDLVLSTSTTCVPVSNVDSVFGSLEVQT